MISGSDMTAEAALTKTVLLGSDIDRDIVIKLMQQDLVGEPTAEFVPAA